VKYLVLVSELGIGKKINLEEFYPKSRGSVGLKGINLNERTGLLAGAEVVEDEDEIVIFTKRGQILRTKVSNINLQSRNSVGVILIKLKQDDKVLGICKI